MPPHNDTATQPTVRWSPLLSEDGRRFLTGHLSAEAFLEAARRRAIEQTCQEMARYSRTATITALIIATFFWTGAGLLILASKIALASAAISVGTIAAVLAPLAYCRLRKNNHATRD